MKELTIQESHGLVIIRVFAMLSIVVCHLFQSYNLGLAGLFNIGVQVFFVLSGYLYGTKMILDWKNWAKKRIHKIYLPYFVFFDIGHSIVCILSSRGDEMEMASNLFPKFGRF